MAPHPAQRAARVSWGKKAWQNGLRCEQAAAWAGREAGQANRA